MNRAGGRCDHGGRNRGCRIGVLIGAVLVFLGGAVVLSVSAMLLAFECAVVTGLVFGWMRARQAARLELVVALGG